MVCPFRTDVEFKYEKVRDYVTGDDRYYDRYLEKSYSASYPQCYENRCPYYSVASGKCKRVEV